MGRHSTALATSTPLSLDSPPKKRKRDQSPTAEIEVDISAPEPPSKKALRKAKKGVAIGVAAEIKLKKDGAANTEPTSGGDLETPAAASKRSNFGVWIGNLPWTATKLDLRNFLTKDAEIADDMITRLHMPSPSKTTVAASAQKSKPQNQGFAYVDFDSEAALANALALSEKLLTGRRLLIKDSKSFEGRPEKSNNEIGHTSSGKPPNKRIFVGNLGFDTTTEALKEHFARCGEISDVHVATFEDTGKCKGYAWLEFATLVASEAAVRGWVEFEQKGVEEEDDEVAEALANQTKPQKKQRLRKWWLNRFGGRPLRMEFAEGKDVRYKKRYGKEAPQRKDGEIAVASERNHVGEPLDGGLTSASGGERRSVGRESARKVDARTIKPGAALAAAPRLTGSIVESQGRKTTFA